MWKKLPFKGCIYFSLIINLVLAALTVVLRGILPPVVPLFYGLPAGTEQLAPSIELAIAPALGFVITLLNIFLSSLTKDIFLKKTLVISSAFISLLLAITFIKIVLLVGFF
jgi:hypothetical protein